jgi:hypothetical protein
MQSEMNVCVAEQNSDDNCPPPDFHDFMHRNNTSKNMDKLWSYFHSTENYPEYYLGIAKRVAICKDPGSEKEDWINAEQCLSVENPTKGSTVTVTIRIKGMTYTKELIFVGWAQTPIHEWRMKSGNVLRLEQKFIDGIPPADKRFLRIHNG